MPCRRSVIRRQRRAEFLLPDVNRRDVSGVGVVVAASFPSDPFQVVFKIVVHLKCKYSIVAPFEVESF